MEIELGQNENHVSDIPILQTLEALLQHEDVLGDVLAIPTENHHTIRHFRDGTPYKNHPLFSSNSCSLMVYGDDFNVGNH